ncbi:MAG: hypothetical protein QGG40_10135, partial [Myxococcota bacterium]|nr:hypothetical protein [Myxococcota bacterium]
MFNVDPILMPGDHPVAYATQREDGYFEIDRYIFGLKRLADPTIWEGRLYATQVVFNPELGGRIVVAESRGET